MANFAYPQKGCDWIGAAGQIFGADGKPQINLIVVVSGIYGGQTIDALGITGTAIGVVDENHLLLVVVDGRQEGYSRGATTTELAGILQGLGATTAYNIDGGGSSTLWFDGEVVNSPSQGREQPCRERSHTDPGRGHP